jgi:isoquinoline 1-oxidoreductase alpha subunit
MAKYTLKVNGRPRTVDVDADTPLLYVLRENLALKGPRFGCGLGQCGACTVHLDGRAVRSCAVDVSVAQLSEITTIEGLAQNGQLHPCQKAWCDLGVPQCGFCQPGQIMSAAALLKAHPNPDDELIDAAMRGNICRCGTYPRIREAIHKAAGG